MKDLMLNISEFLMCEAMINYDHHASSECIPGKERSEVLDNCKG